MTNLRRAFIILAITLFCALSALAYDIQPLPQYIASVRRKPFHTVYCGWSGMISDANARYYYTREEAIKDGHRPCKVCKP